MIAFCGSQSVLTQIFKTFILCYYHTVQERVIYSTSNGSSFLTGRVQDITLPTLSFRYYYKIVFCCLEEERTVTLGSHELEITSLTTAIGSLNIESARTFAHLAYRSVVEEAIPFNPLPQCSLLAIRVWNYSLCYGSPLDAEITLACSWSSIFKGQIRNVQ